AALEMLLTALAYNWTTDWVKAARVQAWSSAFRKVQLAAMRSGKKDRIAALQTHQQELTKLSSEVSFAQLKGMAVTWFLVIAIYTWVGLYLLYLRDYSVAHNISPGLNVVNLGGAHVDLLGGLWQNAPIPLWFALFSLYTVPLSLVFRRVLKHFSLSRHPAALPPSPASATGGAGGGA
ncbi:MAG: TMCO1/EMC3 family protein, partial [Thermoplasmata archaeon]|nr:TMCO1/EMC3 family protein [Thermoplasmata archaeon]